MKGKNEKFNSIVQIIKFITGILSWVVLVLLVIVAAFLVYYFVSMKVYAQKGEEYRPPLSLYTILTQSMVPNINPNDVIVDVKVNNPEDIHIGDVITFVSSATLTQGMTITHRVIDIKEENGEYLYYTKGDANLPKDVAPAKFSNVLGKVLFRVPKLGLLQHFLATKGGWLIVVVIPALCIIITDILKIFRLKTAKNQIEETLLNEEAKKEQEKEEKANIEKKLVERYVSKRSPLEEDPIPKKEYVNVAILSTPKVITPKIELPRRVDLPKLRTVEPVETKKVEIKEDTFLVNEKRFESKSKRKKKGSKNN